MEEEDVEGEVGEDGEEEVVEEKEEVGKEEVGEEEEERWSQSYSIIRKTALTHGLRAGCSRTHLSSISVMNEHV